MQYAFRDTANVVNAVPHDSPEVGIRPQGVCAPRSALLDRVHVVGVVHPDRGWRKHHRQDRPQRVELCPWHCLLVTRQRAIQGSHKSAVFDLRRGPPGPIESLPPWVYVGRAVEVDLAAEARCGPTLIPPSLLRLDRWHMGKPRHWKQGPLPEDVTPKPFGFCKVYVIAKVLTPLSAPGITFYVPVLKVPALPLHAWQSSLPTRPPSKSLSCGHCPPTKTDLEHPPLTGSPRSTACLAG